MIQKMTAHTNLETGKTIYHVYYKRSCKTFGHNDAWPLSVVKFYTDSDTIRTEDRILYGNDGKPATRYEAFAKA